MKKILFKWELSELFGNISTVSQRYGCPVLGLNIPIKHVGRYAACKNHFINNIDYDSLRKHRIANCQSFIWEDVSYNAEKQLFVWGLAENWDLGSLGQFGRQHHKISEVESTR